MKTVSFRLGDLDGNGFVLELHQIELRMKTVSFRLGDLDGDGFV